MKARFNRIKLLPGLMFLAGMLTGRPLIAQDAVPATDSLKQVAEASAFNAQLSQGSRPGLADTNTRLAQLPLAGLKRTPLLTPQQYLKGNAAGLYMREENGEPGTEQFMYIRGITTPMFSKQDLYSIQPVVYVNGVPLTQENAFTYNIQRYDFNRIGPATNLMAALDPRNIESIEVLKTPGDLARLGPLATNGAVWVTTKQAKSGFRQFNFETYFGKLQRPELFPVNAEYERTFREPYYEKYASSEQKQNAALYVRNTNDPDYYGAADWTSVYYRSKPVYYVGGGLLGGMERANFMFNMSNTKDQNFDNTGMDRYSVLFGINMLPLKWLTVSASVNATRMQRQRNKSLRERFAETRFVPYLSNPLAPNKEAYLRFLDKYRGAVDENKNNAVFGYFSGTAKFGELEIRSVYSVDYEEAMRDAFYGKPLMDNNSFLSTYFGFNQRTSIQNTINYNLYFSGKTSKLELEAGQSFTSDAYRYDYVVGYNTPNDFIKVKEIAFDGTYYTNVNDIFAYPFTDALKSALSSVYGRVGYSYKKIADLNFVGRYDGYSGFAPDARWLFTPVVSGRLNLDALLRDQNPVSTLALKASWGIFGKLLQDNRYKIGPQYRVDLGYTDAPLLGSYAGFSGLSQPYSTGFINKYYNWPFSEKLNAGLELGLAEDRYLLGIDYYLNKDRNMIVPIGMPAENGFSYKFVQQMAVENTGVELTATVGLIKGRPHLNWDLYGNFSWNKNRLTKLPYGLSSVVYGNRKIEIGKRVDSYWLYENTGIINTQADVPQGKPNADGTYTPLTFNGMINFAAGDALWRDVNKDGTIDSRDKVLKGNFYPDYTGGIGTAVTYKQFSLDLQFYYALGHQLLNQQTASKLDFINSENSRDISFIKEVTFWQKTFDYDRYPLYNPWSSTIPYRLDQDLFLENADFVKLRYVSLGYDFAGARFVKLNRFSKFLLYATGSNLLTITGFKGGDPEQYDYQGTFSGRYLPVATSYVVGLKLNF